MIPVKTDAKEYDYPDFQPDQILTAEDLNQTFQFLDLQERLTRTNLIGIGIVCGLQATKSADGKTITITKGTGVTSHGYLIVQGIENSNEPILYKKYRSFDPVKDLLYEVFVSGNTPKYDLWELIEQQEEEAGDTELNNGFLANKVCLLFYEILNENAKNCDPISCDDKGVKVYIHIRKLLVRMGDADKIIDELNKKAGASGSGEGIVGLFTLPDVPMPRFDVRATSLETANDVYEAYQKVFTRALVERTGQALNEAHNKFKAFLPDEPNPFSNFSTRFAFLHNGSIFGNSLLHFQYYYGFFCDLLMAYNEWRSAAHTLVSMCTPPEALFPRHLFLGELTEAGAAEKSRYRNYFIPSPIHARHQAYQDFHSLFRRVETLIANFEIPTPSSTGVIDRNIRITPSVNGRYPLGERAIPYYYAPLKLGKNLLNVWNAELTKKGKERHNLHYNPAYNTTDDFVKNPLFYDLEPYNFFRIEGHIGKAFSSVLTSLQEIRNTSRLPFDLVALTVDSLPGSIDASKFPCHFQDLEALYESLRAELVCNLCKAMSCIYAIPKRASFTSEITQKLKVIRSTLSLIKGCNETLNFRESTIGSVYENLHPVLVRSQENSLEVIDALKRDNLSRLMNITDMQAINLTHHGATNPDENELDAVVYFVQLIRLLVLLSDTLPDKLSAYEYSKMAAILSSMKTLLQPNARENKPLINERFAGSQCLKDLLNLCELAPFRAVYEEYLERVDRLKRSQTLKEFSKSHPGISHKGGVPAGGTFIIVYRDLADDRGNTPVRDKSASLSDFIVGEPLATGESPAVTVTTRTPEPLYTQKQLADLTKKVRFLQAKGLVLKEIEDTLGIKVADVVKPKGTFDEQLRNIGQGTVIADFFLPYLCCSDCPPMQFIINLPQPKISFSLKENEYCNDDQAEYTFEANPAGGSIKTDQPDTVADKGEGVFAFLPGKVSIPSGQRKIALTYSYQAEDQSQPLTITIYRKPEVKIVVNQTPRSPFQYQFALDKPDSVTSALWDFGDGSTSSQITPPLHTFPTGGVYTVAVEVKNGVCTARPEPVTVEVTEPERVIVELITTQVCQDVREVPFSITPPGGSLTGEAFSQSPENSGQYLFFPGQVAMEGLAQKTVNFSYTSLQSQSSTFSITVFAMPEGISAFNAIGNMRIQVIFRALKNAMTAYADYGDGTKEEFDVRGRSSFISPPHQYPVGAAGEFILKTSLGNGTCLAQLRDLRVVLNERPQEKQCKSFTGPVEGYSRFSEQVRNAPEFREKYQLMGEADEFFKALAVQLRRTGTVDLRFFDQSTIRPEWIRLLPLTPAALRTLSIQLLGIYAEVLTTIACMRNEDLDGLSREAFEMMLAKWEEIRSLRINRTERLLLQELLTNLLAEVENLNNSGEAAIKPAYLEVLNRLIEMIKSMTES